MVRPADADEVDAATEDRCDFCRLPYSRARETVERDGDIYEFCSNACREAMERRDSVFTEYHGFKRFESGLTALDAKLPQGLPRNSFVLISGDQGTRDSAVHAELVWRTLQRGEPAVVMAFQEPPISIVEEFLTLDWNVLPYLERGQLHIVDCFTYRLSERGRMFDRMNEWNRHLLDIASDATTTVRDPSDIGELQNKLDNCLEALDMVDTGILLVDSLTEFGTLVQPVRAYGFVKDIRADICKGRFVPVFAGATYTGNADIFPHDLGYVVDGIVDMELNGGLVEDTLVKRIRIRKMSGVLTIPEWTAYEYTARQGLITFDPLAEAAARSDGDERKPSEQGSDEQTRPERREPERSQRRGGIGE